MTEIRFYHLLDKSISDALPELVSRGRDAGYRVLARLSDAGTVATISDCLWSYAPESFLAHGRAGDSRPDRQPIWLTDGDDAPNDPDLLVSANSRIADDVERFARCCDLFDGKDDTAVAAARDRWTAYRAAGHDVSYWQQTPGGWQQKA